MAHFTLVLRCTYGLVYDLKPYGIIVSLVKFSLFFVVFLILISAIYLVNKDYYLLLLRDGLTRRAGTTSRIAECYDRVKYPTEDQEACPCPEHTIQLAGLWSGCQLDADLTQFDHDLRHRSIGQFRPGRGYCGVGSRSHALVCVGPDKLNISALVCGSSGLHFVTRNIFSSPFRTSLNC